MLGYVAIVHIYFIKKLIFSIKARRGLERQNCSRKNSAQCDTLLDFRTFQFPAVLYCAESDSAHIRKNEFFRETILDSLSVTQMGLIHKKNEKKSRGTASLTQWK